MRRLVLTGPGQAQGQESLRGVKRKKGNLPDPHTTALAHQIKACIGSCHTRAGLTREKACPHCGVHQIRDKKHSTRKGDVVGTEVGSGSVRLLGRRTWTGKRAKSRTQNQAAVTHCAAGVEGVDVLGICALL